MEEWRDIEGYEGVYQVSSFGRVKSFNRYKTSRILKQGVTRHGYAHVTLCKDRKHKICSVHRLVAEAFIPNPDCKPQINHIDGNKINNYVENLEWATQSENMRHADALGLRKLPQGANCPWAKLTNEQVIYIRNNPDNLTGAALCKMFDVPSCTISDVQTGKIYRNAGGKIREPQKPPPPRQTLKIPPAQREEIRRIYIKGDRIFGAHALARKFGVDKKTVQNILKEE